MAKSSNRVGLFTSARGRRVRQGLMALGCACLAWFFVAGLFSGPPPESSDEALSFTTASEEPRTPEVAAPVARPFALPIEGAASTASAGDIYGDGGDSEDDSETDANGEEVAQLPATAAYQAAVTLTQKVAAAFATHSAEVTPQDWVDTLPNLSEELKAELLASAEQRWPNIVDRGSKVTAVAVTQSVTPIYSRGGGTELQLAVTVTKDTVYEGRSGYASQSFAVTLKRSAASGSDWAVTSIL